MYIAPNFFNTTSLGDPPRSGGPRAPPDLPDLYGRHCLGVYRCECETDGVVGKAAVGPVTDKLGHYW
jgi:hypothetical protein